MKTVGLLRYFLLVTLTGLLSFGPLLRAQENAPAPEAPPAPAAPSEPAQPAKEPDDVVETPEPATAPKAERAEEPDAKVAPVKELKSRTKHGRNGTHYYGSERVSIFSDSTLEAGQSAHAVVSILGSSQSAGDVREAVVSVLGGSRVTGGTVGEAVVSVLGNTYVNGRVSGEMVTVLGNAELGPDAVVEGDVVTVGGKLKRAEGAVIRGEVHSVSIGGPFFDFGGLTTWLHECLLKGRPLAFHDDLAWAWALALLFLAISLLIAVIAPRGVVKCAETLEQKPGSCLLAAILALLLTPVAYILLTFTLTLVVGFVLIPVFSFGLFVAGLVGKAVMLAWLGRRLLGTGGNVIIAVLLGGVIVLGLYTLWGVGFVTYGLIRFVGLGVVVYTLIQHFKDTRPPRPAAPAPVQVPTSGVVPSPVTPASAMSEAVPPTQMSGVGPAAFATTPAATVPPDLTLPPLPPSVAPPIRPTAVISAATLPRAGFWIRLAASLLDFVMIGVALAISSRMFYGWFAPGSNLPFWFAVYCIVMWATKGTTVGGIICGLKVVRLDDRPLDWGIAIVRALGGFLSFAVAGLGFIWVAFDDERQSWHDKIAGTTIVRVPKGTALV